MVGESWNVFTKTSFLLKSTLVVSCMKVKRETAPLAPSSEAHKRTVMLNSIHILLQIYMKFFGNLIERVKVRFSGDHVYNVSDGMIVVQLPP